MWIRHLDHFLRFYLCTWYRAICEFCPWSTRSRMALSQSLHTIDHVVLGIGRALDWHSKGFRRTCRMPCSPHWPARVSHQSTQFPGRTGLQITS
jgi:hypothetical protein